MKNNKQEKIAEALRANLIRRKKKKNSTCSNNEEDSKIQHQTENSNLEKPEKNPKKQ